jgi:hypothetical protein
MPQLQTKVSYTPEKTGYNAALNTHAVCEIGNIANITKGETGDQTKTKNLDKSSENKVLAMWQQSLRLMESRVKVVWEASSRCMVNLRNGQYVIDMLSNKRAADYD